MMNRGLSVPSYIGSPADAKTYFASLTRWLEQQSPANAAANDEYNHALDAVSSALLSTRRYLAEYGQTGRRDEGREEHLSMLWHHASSAIRPYSRELGRISWVKAHGWADGSVWARPEYRDVPVKLDQVLTRLMALPSPEDPRSRPSAAPGWFAYAGALFSLLALASIFYLIVRSESMPADRRILFDVFASLCAAAGASFFGGTAKARGQIPWVGQSPVRFVATGGLGFFIVTFVVLYSANH